MSVVNKLTGSKNRRNEFGFVNQVVQTGFQNADQVFSRVTASSDGFNIIFVELFFVNVAVIGFQFLFGIQLFAGSGSQKVFADGFMLQPEIMSVVIGLLVFSMLLMLLFSSVF